MNEQLIDVGVLAIGHVAAWQQQCGSTSKYGDSGMSAGEVLVTALSADDTDSWAGVLASGVTFDWRAKATPTGAATPGGTAPSLKMLLASSKIELVRQGLAAAREQGDAAAGEELLRFLDKHVNRSRTYRLVECMTAVEALRYCADTSPAAMTGKLVEMMGRTNSKPLASRISFALVLHAPIDRRIIGEVAGAKSSVRSSRTYVSLSPQAEKALEEVSKPMEVSEAAKRKKDFVTVYGKCAPKLTWKPATKTATVARTEAWPSEAPPGTLIKTEPIDLLAAAHREMWGMLHPKAGATATGGTTSNPDSCRQFGKALEKYRDAVFGDLAAPGSPTAGDADIIRQEQTAVRAACVSDLQRMAVDWHTIARLLECRAEQAGKAKGVAYYRAQLAKADKTTALQQARSYAFYSLALWDLVLGGIR